MNFFQQQHRPDSAYVAVEDDGSTLLIVQIGRRSITLKLGDVALRSLARALRSAVHQKRFHAESLDQELRGDK